MREPVGHVEHVRPDAGAAAGELGGRRRERRRVQIDQHERGALGRGACGDCLADTRRRPGDEDPFVRQRPHSPTMESDPAGGANRGPHSAPRLGVTVRADYGSARMLAKRRCTVLGRQMAYVETGTGAPIVFLHGNPTSSYLWRNVMPHLADQGRCIAPDLIGMGDSDKLEPSGPERYRFLEHREFLDGLLDALGVREDVTLVIHDWGSALGFDWARRHPDAVRGIAYMEAIVAPLTWDDWPEAGREIFRMFRSPAGEQMILERNLFVETVLPGSILRRLTDAEMAEYRRPFATPGEGRRSMLSWPRQIPIEGEPAEVDEIVSAYAAWLASAPVPKLFINADPGAILVGRQREACRRWPNQQEVTVRGVHFVQEDSPDEIGRAIAAWRRG
ncbi:MAG TPA: haloalkane dehalogenase [Candidatus Limnocylindria bacterium]|nr:haloalkane dehalogenase [Candidatus Limnocylindria bacterium]